MRRQTHLLHSAQAMTPVIRLRLSSLSRAFDTSGGCVCCCPGSADIVALGAQLWRAEVDGGGLSLRRFMGGKAAELQLCGINIVRHADPTIRLAASGIAPSRRRTAICMPRLAVSPPSTRIHSKFVKDLQGSQVLPYASVDYQRHINIMQGTGYLFTGTLFLYTAFHQKYRTNVRSDMVWW